MSIIKDYTLLFNLFVCSVYTKNQNLCGLPLHMQNQTDIQTPIVGTHCIETECLHLSHYRRYEWL